MPGTYSLVKTVVTGETITAADRNAEHTNHITNADPDGIGDASADVAEMQATADPYPASSESLATNDRGETQRLRYLLKQITGEAQWYIDPDTSILLEFNKGADIASATALALGTDGNYFDVTGTTAITSINTRRVGSIVKLHFDGILTLTHHATNLILPGGANITTAAGDEAEFVEYAAGTWRCTNYQLASGVTLSDHGHTGGADASNIDTTGLAAGAVTAAKATALLGTRVTKAFTTTFQATTDGFVEAHDAISSGGVLTGITDSAASPTVVRQRAESPSTSTQASIFFAVIKNEYYKVTTTGAASGAVYFIPLGS